MSRAVRVAGASTTMTSAKIVNVIVDRTGRAVRNARVQAIRKDTRWYASFAARGLELAAEGDSRDAALNALVAQAQATEPPTR